MVAADMPMAKVSRPARHQGIGDHRLLNEPMEKKVSPVMTVEASMVAGSPSTKGRSGIEPQTMKARKVVQCGPSRRAADRRQTMLLGHHGLDPALALLGDHLHGAVERFALEALGLEDLTDLLALALGGNLDVALLHVAHMLVFLDLGSGAGEIGGGHGEAVGKKIGHAENEQRLGGKRRSGHACDHGEGGHGAVDAAIDPVAQIADPRPLFQPLGDFARAMTVLEMSGVHLRLLGP